MKGICIDATDAVPSIKGKILTEGHEYTLEQAECWVNRLHERHFKQPAYYVVELDQNYLQSRFILLGGPDEVELVMERLYKLFNE